MALDYPLRTTTTQHFMDKRLLGEARLARFAFMATVGLSLMGGLLIVGQAFLLSRIISRVFLAGPGGLNCTGCLWGCCCWLGCVPSIRSASS
jgi:hypothetical protein